ncbi:hypothetical protein [Photobacterium kishitanii]|uniref:hypothetical protein n=1 Tax=Photobacterium kishitanii TaxID=318456 RepID=UPI0007F91865|nr:hypothetical protein [Photobacterium kishitanii]OBU30654.1 hypothetical protein AYY23_04615 [Photobacterium kishitanii]PSW47490.1 hypothetical protein C0W66_18085 [Photobacterium kishitanii]
MDYQHYYEAMIEILVDNFDTDIGEYNGQIELSVDEYNDSCSIAKEFNIAYNPDHSVLEVLHQSTPEVGEITSYIVSAPALGYVIDYLEDELIVDFED